MSSSTKKRTSTTRSKKNTNGKNKRYTNANSKRNKSNGTNENSFIKAEVVLLIVLAFSIILLISNFGIGGIVGNYISSVAFGVFGFMAYILPFVLFFGCGLYLSNKQNTKVVIKIIAGILLFLFLCVMSQLISKAYEASSTVGDYYQYSALHKSAGGVIGGELCKLFMSAFGVVGGYVITITLIIISLVIITEKSFLKGVKKGSDKVYSTAKSTAIAGNEKRRERAEQRQILEETKRLNKKVEGVSINTSIDSVKKSKKQDIHEITMEAQKTDDLSGLNIERAYQGKDNSVVNFEEYHVKPINANSIQPEDIVMNEPEILRPIEPEDKEEQPAEVMPEMTSQEVEALEVVKAAPKKKEQTTKEEALEQAEQIHKEIAASTQIKEKEYVFPPIDLLKRGAVKGNGDSDIHLRETASKLQQTLQNFGVRVNVTNISCGPTVTRYELQPEMGVKVSKIVSLSDDIKLNLAAADIRIEAPIPGKAAVGIEVPNKENSTVMLRDLIETSEFKKHPSNIAFAAGKDISGHAIVTDIAKMPHLLIAGATGSGKSVCINTLIMSILYKANPDDVKLIMIDPKVVELSVYNGIPHLFIPVVTDPKKAAGALNWAVAEMTTRYKKFADLNVRDLKGYNEKIKSIEDIEDDNKPEKLPQIIIIVDELADLMMVAPGEVEDAICRLAQLARAAGLHLIIATQRPSVNVITGLIKANMPSRIAFAVSSGVDSRTIIDMNGAEKLLGKGDMLFYPQGYQKPARVQGAFVSDKEVSDVVEFLTSQHGVAEYNKDIEATISNATASTMDSNGSATDRDTYFVDAGKFIIEKDKASIGMLQRVFKIGFNRAARIMDQLCDAGVVGEEEGTKPRKVLMSLEEFEEFIDECV